MFFCSQLKLFRSIIIKFRYVIGENKPTEPPFKLIYYTGKTLQNTYSGAFVYAREPELPSEAMASVYTIAREAGLDPRKVEDRDFDSIFCRMMIAHNRPHNLIPPELLAVVALFLSVLQNTECLLRQRAQQRRACCSFHKSNPVTRRDRSKTVHR